MDVSKLNRFTYKHDLQNICELVSRQKNELKQLTANQEMVCESSGCWECCFGIITWHTQVGKSRQRKASGAHLAAHRLTLEQDRDQQGPCAG